MSDIYIFFTYSFIKNTPNFHCQYMGKRIQHDSKNLWFSREGPTISEPQYLAWIQTLDGKPDNIWAIWHVDLGIYTMEKDERGYCNGMKTSSKTKYCIPYLFEVVNVSPNTIKVLQHDDLTDWKHNFSREHHIKLSYENSFWLYPIKTVSTIGIRCIYEENYCNKEGYYVNCSLKQQIETVNSPGNEYIYRYNKESEVINGVVIQVIRIYKDPKSHDHPYVCFNHLCSNKTYLNMVKRIIYNKEDNIEKSIINKKDNNNIKIVKELVTDEGINQKDKNINKKKKK
eukprot:GHVR01085804.1.p1 GENE.GHVR01085804.1~~GHVR01085804.1.p1  ORF type:complete len:285 (+),score=34.91 GHVR01085804.1:1590-2444(+)